MTPPRFVPQIQVLRAVAVAAVVGFHLWPHAIPGGYVGVDVFFVVSGYLITGHLLRDLDGSAPVSLPAFWARRARRLLPLALVVLVATLAATTVILPLSRWQEVARQAGYASVYVLNWRLASDAADYFGAEQPATAVQHYWSLSVEEQFYILWPLLLVGAAWLTRRWRGDPRRRLMVVMASVAVVSFGYSVVYSQANPPAAYFSTFTHAWEFALGGLAVMLWPEAAAATLRPERARALLTATGLGAIVAASILYDSTTTFPGYTAALPSLGAVAVIAAGRTVGPGGIDALVRRRSIMGLGDISYGLYLWHWPLIVLAPPALARALTTADRVVILAAAVGLAVLSKRLVEDPVRFAPSWNLLGVRGVLGAGAVGAVLVASIAGLAWRYVDVELLRRTGAVTDVVAASTAGDVVCFGALSMAAPDRCPDRHRIDDGWLLPSLKAFGVGQGEPFELSPRINAREVMAGTTDFTVAVVGDSHAMMYAPAVARVAEQQGWRVIRVRHIDCTTSAPTWTSSYPPDNTDGCRAYRQSIMEDLGPAGIDLIVTSSASGFIATRETPQVQAQAAQAFADLYGAWDDQGIRVVAIADVPGVGAGGHECLDRSIDAVDPCTSSRSEVLEPDPIIEAVARLDRPGVTLLDMTDAYCDEVCHLVVGGIPAYHSGNHISSGFAVSLIPRIEAHLRQRTDLALIA